MKGNSSNYAEESQDRSILERSYDHSALLDETPPIPKDAKGVRDLLFGIHQAKMRARSRAHLNTSVTSIGELRYHLQGIRAQAEQALGDAQIRQTRRYDCYYDPPSLTLPERYKPKLSPPRQYRSISQDYQGFRAAPFYANQSLPNIGRNDASWAANGQPGYHASGDNHSTVLESSNIMEDFNAPEDFSQTDLNYGPNVTILDSDDEAGLQVKLENLEDHNEIQRETNQSLEMFYTDEDYEDSEVEVDHKEEHPQTIEILSSESEENDSFVQNLESETDFESEDISSQDSGSAHSDDVSESQTPSSQRSQELHPTVNSSGNFLNCSQVNSAVQENSNTSADAPLLYQEKPLLEEELVSKSSMEATETETSYENPTSYICQDLPSHSPNKWSMMATTMPDSSCPVSYAADQLVIEHDQVSHSYISVTDIPEAVTSQANPLDIGFENFNPDSQLLIPTIGSSHIILTEDGLTNHSSSSHSQFLNFENQVDSENSRLDGQLSSPNQDTSPNVSTEADLPCQVKSSHSNSLELEDQYTLKTSNLGNQYLSPTMDASPDIEAEESEYDQSHIIPSGLLDYEASAQDSQGLYSSMDLLNARSGEAEFLQSHNSPDILSRQVQCAPEATTLDNQHLSSTMDASPDIEAEEAEYDQSHIIPSGLLDYEAECADKASAQDSQSLHPCMGFLNARSGQAEFLQSHTSPSDVLSRQVQYAPEAIAFDNQYLSPTMDASPDIEAEEAEYDQSHIIPSGLLDYEAECADEASAQDSQSLHPSMGFLNARSGEAEFLQSHTSPSDVLSRQVQYAPEAIAFDNQYLSPTMDASPDIEAEEAEYDQSHIIPSGLLDYEAECADKASAQDSQSLHPCMGFLNARSGQAEFLQSHTSPSDVLSRQVQYAPEAIAFDNQYLSPTMDASPDIEAEEAEYDQSHIIPSGLLDYEAECADEASAQDSQSLHPSMGFLNARSGEAEFLQSHTSPSDVLSRQVQRAPEAITFDNQHLSSTMDASPDNEAEQAEYDQSHIIPSGLLDYEAECTDKASAQDNQSLYSSMGLLNARSGQAEFLQSHTSPSDVLSRQVQYAPEAITFDNQHLSPTMDASPDNEAEEAENVQSHIILSGLLGHDDQFTSEVSAQDNQSLHTSMELLNVRSGEAEINSNIIFPTVVVTHENQSTSEPSSSLTKENSGASIRLSISKEPSPGSSKHETISRKRHRESLGNSEFGSHSSSKLIFFPSEENGSRPSTPPGPDDIGSAQKNLAPEKASTLNLVSMEPVDDHILNSVYTTDEEYYDLDASYLTVSPSEYATPEDGGSPIKIKRHRLRRRGPQGYQLKIASSRELAGLGPLPREVVSPYPLRRVLPEGSSQKKRQFQSDSQGGPTNLTSLKRAKATPYILREKDGASYQNVNTSRSSLAPINPATTPQTPAKGNSARRFSKSPAPKR
ncbi:hypothetical protein DSO57_1007798 [Entomophthora muscae]|uniref:Uncharacterized protein n=1 Tax=Entomophthora muscae TaxID=34485 RepID=A0ACC2RM44_9FUNG|nr:hypothetical protein DSO57_1007798 [Entomophthora muscae]